MSRQYRTGEATDLFGVGPDTVRRIVDPGRPTRDKRGRRVIEGADLAAFTRNRKISYELTCSLRLLLRASMRERDGYVTRLIRS
jgi:hypothetical protein